MIAMGSREGKFAVGGGSGAGLEVRWIWKRLGERVDAIFVVLKYKGMFGQ